VPVVWEYRQFAKLADKGRLAVKQSKTVWAFLWKQRVLLQHKDISLYISAPRGLLLKFYMHTDTAFRRARFSLERKRQRSARVSAAARSGSCESGPAVRQEEPQDN
jgi:hypothetical protein